MEDVKVVSQNFLTVMWILSFLGQIRGWIFWGVSMYTLLRNKMFMLNLMPKRNASKFAVLWNKKTDIIFVIQLPSISRKKIFFMKLISRNFWAFTFYFWWVCNVYKPYVFGHVTRVNCTPKLCSIFLSSPSFWP